MIVYEKDNKLNINFENQLDNPDIELGKSEIKVDGNNIVNGGGGILFLHAFNDNGSFAPVEKNSIEIKSMYESGQMPVFAATYSDSTTVDFAYMLNIYDDPEIGLTVIFVSIFNGDTYIVDESGSVRTK